MRRSANNGNKARVEHFVDGKQSTACILVDMHLERGDGLEIIRTVRNHPDFSDLPIIALGSKAVKGDRHQSVEAGANDYLAKPVALETLHAMLQVWLLS